MSRNSEAGGTGFALVASLKLLAGKTVLIHPAERDQHRR
jgi:hypothetical protein